MVVLLAMNAAANYYALAINRLWTSYRVNMTLANLTRSLLFATALLLGGAAAVAADEPDNGLVGGALGGAADLVEAGAETVTELPVVDDLHVAPVVETVETVVAPVTKPVKQVVAPAVERVVEPVPAVVKPVATVVAPAVETAVKPVVPGVDTLAPAVGKVVPVVEPVAKPVAQAVRPIGRPIEDVAPVTKIIVDSIAAPVVDALAPIVESIAPAIVPLVPVVDTVTEVVRPVTDPIGGALPPVIGPVGVGPILDPILRPEPAITPSSPIAGSSDDAVPSSPLAVGPSVDRTGSASDGITRTALHPAPGRSRDDATATRNGRAVSTAGATSTSLAHTPTPLAAVTGERVRSGPDGGFSIVILAAMALAVIASRSSLSAPRIARPPSLSFAPAVPPA
jgi:hypothetical protein